VNAPDADILREIIELLKARVATGAATFLVKVKAHRGEPLNELNIKVCRRIRTSFIFPRNTQI
jgi:hypothetical protein